VYVPKSGFRKIRKVLHEGVDMDGGNARIRRARNHDRVGTGRTNRRRHLTLAVVAWATIAVGITMVPVTGAPAVGATSLDQGGMDVVGGAPGASSPDAPDADPTGPTTGPGAGGDPVDTTDPPAPTGATDPTAPVDGDDATGGSDEPAPTTPEPPPSAGDPAPGEEGDVARATLPASDLARPAWAVSNAGAATAWLAEPGAGGGLVTDPFGNTFVAGEFSGQIAIHSAAADPIALDGGDDHVIYVARYAADGTVTAATVVARNASADTLGRDPAGNVYVVGHGTNVAVPSARGTIAVGTGAFVVKLRNDLSSVWATKVTNNQTPHSLSPWDAPAAASGNGAGEVAVLAFDTVARLGSDGRVLRTKRATETASVALGEDGTMYEAVRTTAFLRASGPDGAITWNLGGVSAGGTAHGSSVAMGPDGEVSVAGVVKSTTTFGPPSAPHLVAAPQPQNTILRVHVDGTVRWSATLGPRPYSYYDGWNTDPTIDVGASGDTAAAYFDGWSSHVERIDPAGSVVSHTTAQTVYWWLPSLRVAIDAGDAIAFEGTHTRDVTFGSPADPLVLPRPNLASIFLAHWGPTAAPTPGSLRVTASFGGQGQADVWIGVTPAGAAEGPVQWSLTDVDGVARFTPLTPGPYRITELDWQGRFAREWFDGASTFADSTDVSVRPGDDAALTMALDVRPQSGIVGTATDDAGQPVAGVVAQLFSADGFMRSTKTTSTGAYFLTGLASGPYWVRFVDPAGRYRSQWFDGVDAVHDRSTITVGTDLVAADAQLQARQVDVALDSSFTTASARAGQPFPLMIDVRNLGPDPVAAVDVRPVLPSGMTVQSIEGEMGHARDDGWRTAAIEPGGSTFVMVTVAVEQDLAGRKVTVGATSSVTAVDTDPSNDHTSRTLHVIGGNRPDGLWAQSIHGPGEAIAYGIAVDGEGNTYASGWFRGMVTFGEGAAAVTWSDDRTVPDMWFAKFDKRGALLWVRRGAGHEQMDPTGGGVAVGPDGSLYVTGFFEGEVSFGEGADKVTLYAWSGTQMFLLRFTPDGKVSWARAYGQAAYGWTVAVGADGVAWVAGRERRSMYNPATRRYELGQGFVAGFDTKGTVVRVLSQTSTKDEPQAMARNATLDDDGVLYVVGTLGSDMTFGAGTRLTTLHSRGGYDGFLAIYEPGGELRAVTQIGGPGTNERVSGVRPAGDGDTFVSGNLEGGAIVGNDPTSLASSGGYLLRVAPDGTSRWARSLGANVRQVVADQFGALYVMGGMAELPPFATDGVAAAKGPKADDEPNVWGPEDAYVAKFYPDGTFDWILRGGGPRRDVAFTATVDGTGIIHLAGSTSAVAAFCLGPDTSVVHSEGKTNAFVAACAPPDGVEHPWNDDRVEVDATAPVHTGSDAMATSVTVTVENRGPYESSPADLTLSLPDELTLIGLSSDVGTVSGGVWHGTAMPSGSSATITAEVLVAAQAVPVTLPVTATLHASDLVPWNNEATTMVDVLAPPPPPPPTTTTTTKPPTTTTTTEPTTTTTTATSPTSATAPTTRAPLLWPQLIFAPTTTASPTSSKQATTNGQRQGKGGPAATTPAATGTDPATGTRDGQSDGAGRGNTPASSVARQPGVPSSPDDAVTNAAAEGDEVTAGRAIAGSRDTNDLTGAPTAGAAVLLITLTAGAVGALVWRRRRSAAVS
jgi:uncharacterized repeat protein (TIGR01451 family)